MTESSDAELWIGRNAVRGLTLSYIEFKKKPDFLNTYSLLKGIHFWLRWVFTAMHRLSLGVASGSYSWL